MKTTISYSALIHVIEKIYLRVALIVLHKRMDGYHRQSLQGMKSHSHDIKSTLLNCVDEIVNNYQADAEGSHVTGESVSSFVTTAAHTHEQTQKPYLVNKENVGDLSKYFKARGSGADLHPGIEKKLEHSTWEHIHAAIRYAGQGDKRNAKLHVGIASSACMELAHYMHEEYYEGFILEIEKQLDSMKPENHVVGQ